MILSLTFSCTYMKGNERVTFHLFCTILNETDALASGLLSFASIGSIVG